MDSTLGLPAGQALLREEHPRFSRVCSWVRRMRNELLAVGIGVALIEGIVEHERPIDLFEGSRLVPLALAMIAAGLVLRIAALGSVRKNEQLETTGVYSLCRHPLYLGTILIYFGFCVILDDDEFYYFGAAYFPLCYVPMIAWEEASLRRQFPVEHSAYRRRTPALLPVGRFVRGRFDWSLARRRGAMGIVVGIVIFLACVEGLAVAFSPEAMGGSPPDAPAEWTPTP